MANFHANFAFVSFCILTSKYQFSSCFCIFCSVSRIPRLLLFIYMYMCIYIYIYIYIHIHIYESWSHSTFISLFEAVLIFIILLAIAIIPSGIISTSMGLRYFCLHAFTTHHIADWTNLTIVANMFKYCKLQNFAVVYSITD